jgi:hypothetical protein
MEVKKWPRSLKAVFRVANYSPAMHRQASARAAFDSSYVKKNVGLDIYQT